MVYTKLELPGDVQEQSLSSALLKIFSEKFHKLHKKISLLESLFFKMLA